MSYRVILDDLALEDLDDLPAGTRRRMLRRLEALADDPRPGAAHALTRELRGLWRLRVGDYRASYTIDEETQTVHVWNAGHRSRFYDRASRKRR